MNYSLSPELFHAVALALGWTLLHSLWQGALVGGAAAWILGALPTRLARARHAVCMLGLVLLLAGGVETFTRSWAGFHSVATDPASPAHAPGEPAGFSSPAPVDASPAVQRMVALRAIFWRFEVLLPWMAFAWMGGVLLLSLRQALGWQRLARWRRESVAADAALSEAFTRLLQRLGHRTSVLSDFRRVLDSASRGALAACSDLALANSDRSAAGGNRGHPGSRAGSLCPA